MDAPISTTAKVSEGMPAQSDEATTIDEGEFRRLIARRAQRLFDAAAYLTGNSLSGAMLTRPLLGELLSQAEQLEELLDVYGAQGNARWYRFRSMTAAIKIFSGVSYEFHHIHHVLPGYRVISVEQDFIAKTDEALAFTGGVLLHAAEGILATADELGLTGEPDIAGKEAYEELSPPGRLLYDRPIRRIEKVSETITNLATKFLNVSTESELVHVAGRIDPWEYASCVPDPIGEERLRSLEQSFHNLQSIYDTYVWGTETESADADLPVVRGHVSLVYHLLKSATTLAHYYERHGSGPTIGSGEDARPLVDTDSLLGVLMEYTIGFASRYIDSVKNLCRSVLKRYSEVARIKLSVPRYRGFHVRPATLVAKIVLHYGSQVQMELEGQSYDASSPMDIFRANEKINAHKRSWLASRIAEQPTIHSNNGGDFETVIREIVHTLAEQNKIVIYKHPLEFVTNDSESQSPLLQKVLDEIARLQATGSIDIETDLDITFVGDRRVLADIKLLADCGYGEDNFGNNITLPAELAYLRH